MSLWEEKSKVLLCPAIFFNELYDETEGRWLELVFKVGEDLVGGINAGGRSSLGWLVDLEEEWVDWRWILTAEIRLEELSFNTGRYWENYEEMCSCELLLYSSALELEDLSLKREVQSWI